MTVTYCTRCVYPSSSAAPLTFDADGVCSGCRTAIETERLDWDSRWKMLEKLVEPYRGKGDYDLVVPVSGGKDSYFQVHTAIHRLGLKPLLVTYHGNRFMPEGEYNLQRLRQVFDVDHLILKPSQNALIKLNRVGFTLHGDMNWHNHCGVMTLPIQMAVKYNIPLILWGEHSWIDLGGMFSYNDFPEFTAKTRLEHNLHGYDWYNFTDDGLEKSNQAHLKEGLTSRDLNWAKYPTDDEIDQADIRGIYLGLFELWNGNRNAELMSELYGWQEAQTEFDRTYRKISNLDDQHENGVHDYMKFIKFGYGRGSDHAMKDIRSGLITRSEGIEIVKKYDHVRPQEDLDSWLKYVGMTEEEFDVIADTFRDPRVWRIEGDEWVKENVWGESSSYGKVKLPPESWSKYQLDEQP